MPDPVVPQCRRCKSYRYISNRHSCIFAATENIVDPILGTKRWTGTIVECHEKNADNKCGDFNK